MAYRVEFTTAATREIRKLRKSIQPKLMKSISGRINGLAADPRPPGAEKLEGYEYWRVRAGDYRIVYSIEDELLTVLVIKIGNRRDIYEGL